MDIESAMKKLENTTSIVQISAYLKIIYEQIQEKRYDENSKELNLLLKNCRTDNPKLSFMCCEIIKKLIEENVLNPKKILLYFLTVVQNSNFEQYIVLLEIILSLIWLDLEHKITQVGRDEQYKCPYDVQHKNHPLVVLIQYNPSNINVIAFKLREILNCNDKKTLGYRIEYLRPVYLYVFCYSTNVPTADSIGMWMNLVAYSKQSVEVNNLVHEIISWSKINSSTNCLYTKMMLIEAINDFDLDTKQSVIVYLSVITNHVIDYGIEPRSILKCILQVLQKESDPSERCDNPFLNVILILLSQTLHKIYPMYLHDLLQIFEFIIIKKNCGNHYILNMVFDGLIQWLPQTKFIPHKGMPLAYKILEKIVSVNRTTVKVNKITSECSKNTNLKYYHPDIALAFNIAKLAESFESKSDESEFKNVFTFVDSLNVKTKAKFCDRIQLFLRGLFLSKDQSLDCWFKVYQTILLMMETNETIAHNFISTYINKIVNENHPEIQLELLKGLANFAISKDCIPIILQIYKACLANKLDMIMAFFLKLLKIDFRTFSVFKDIITSRNLTKLPMELITARAFIIQEIIHTRPNAIGLEMLPVLSEILSICSNEEGDLATSISLNAIVILCENKNISIISTWKSIKGKFRHEKRLRSLKSLYNFLGKIGLIDLQTQEYRLVVDEVLEILWSVVSTSNNSELIKSALEALSNFDIQTKMTLKHIPDKFKIYESGDSIYTGRSMYTETDIPGGVWFHLLQKIKPDCGEAAADLIAHYIDVEISHISKIYWITESKIEPHSFNKLSNNSPLKAITDLLVMHSRHIKKNPNQLQILVIANALRAISQKFSNRIPPFNWRILDSFYELKIFSIRKYCISIAVNQMQYSESAKNFIEKVLLDFKPNAFEEDLSFIMDILPNIANNVNFHILKQFIDKISDYCYQESKLNNFQEGCLFEKFLDSIKSIFINECSIPEVFSIFTLIALHYMDSINLDTKLFQKYTEFIGVLDNKSIDTLTSTKDQTDWNTIDDSITLQINSKSIDRLKKATLIRCYLVLYNTNIENSLNWLNPIFDSYVEYMNEQIFFFRHFSATLYAYNDDKNSCEWIINLFMEIQIFSNKSSIEQKSNHDKLLFLLDVFVLAVVVLSSCATLLGNLDVAATSRELRMEIFPESLQTLCDRPFWVDKEAVIYKCVYETYNNPILPDDYSKVFKNAIICGRHKPSFKPKYVGMRK